MSTIDSDGNASFVDVTADDISAHKLTLDDAGLVGITISCIAGDAGTTGSIDSAHELRLNKNCKLSEDGKILTVEKVTGSASKAESLINSVGEDYSFTESQPITFVDGKPTAINKIQITGDVTCNEVSVKSIKIGNHVLDENKLIKLLNFLETLEIEN